MRNDSGTPSSAPEWPDDHVLLAQAATGSTEALGMLYDRYGRLVFSLALRITGDRCLAEEITQDTFLRLWQNADRYEAERGRLTAWLLTITRHRAIDALRSRRRTAQQHEVSLPETASAGLDFSALLQLRTDLQQALAALPPNQREVIELIFFSGMTRQEIAHHTNNPLATVHTRLRLGLEKLRSMLLGDEQSYEIGRQ